MLNLPSVTDPIHASISLPGSKSLTNRLLLLSAMTSTETRLLNPLWADDTVAMYRALQQLGLTIAADDTQVIVKDSLSVPSDRVQLNCKQAGTVARLLIPVAIAVGGHYSFEADTQLQRRPIEPLLQTLNQQGMDWRSGGDNNWPLQLEQTGGLKGGHWSINAELSSQFVSGLLLAALKARDPVTLTVTTPFRQPYVTMTQAVIHRFHGVVEQIQPQQFYIDPNIPLQSPASLAIEPDASTASYFLAIAALTGGDIKLNNVNIATSTQQDWQFLSILEQMNCQVIRAAQYVRVIGTQSLQGVDVSMHTCSDVFMTVAALAPYASSATMIRDIGHTRYQESDRIQSVASEWRKLGIQVETGEDWIIIHPGQPGPAVVDSHEDHRIAMALAVLALKTKGVQLTRSTAVTKTCPDFFQRWLKVLNICV